MCLITLVGNMSVLFHIREGLIEVSVEKHVFLEYYMTDNSSSMQMTPVV